MTGATFGRHIGSGHPWLRVCFHRLNSGYAALRRVCKNCIRGPQKGEFARNTRLRQPRSGPLWDVGPLLQALSGHGGQHTGSVHGGTDATSTRCPACGCEPEVRRRAWTRATCQPVRCRSVTATCSRVHARSSSTRQARRWRARDVDGVEARPLECPRPAHLCPGVPPVGGLQGAVVGDRDARERRRAARGREEGIGAGCVDPRRQERCERSRHPTALACTLVRVP